MQRNAANVEKVRARLQQLETLAVQGFEERAAELLSLGDLPKVWRTFKHTVHLRESQEFMCVCCLLFCLMYAFSKKDH